jgi:hypothetical protein
MQKKLNATKWQHFKTSTNILMLCTQIKQPVFYFWHKIKLGSHDSFSPVCALQREQFSMQIIGKYNTVREKAKCFLRIKLVIYPPFPLNFSSFIYGPRSKKGTKKS